MDDQMQARESLASFNRDSLASSDLTQQVEQKAHKISDRLSYAYHRAASAFTAYVNFKDTRGSRFGDQHNGIPIMRPPSYPDSHVMTFSILASLVLFEGLANAYFFSKGSDLGLLGGWIQAITVASANVIASFFLIGFLGLRMLQNPSRPFSFAAALILVPLATAFILFLNFTAAHYRDLLEINAASLALGDVNRTGDMLEPVTRALDFGPFVTLEALLLFILGVTFSVIAAFKGATFDDRLIGYGAAHRRLVNASSHLAAVLKQLPAQTSILEMEEGYDQNSTRTRAIALKHKIDEMFAAEFDEALSMQDKRRQQREALDDYQPFSSEPPPRA